MTSTARPPRGPLLTLLLLLLTGSSLFGIGSVILFFSVLHRVADRQIDPTQNVAHAQRLLLVMLLASMIRFICAAGMWMWKQWGVFGYVAMALLTFSVETKLNPGHRPPYGYLVWILFVAVAAVPKWSHFER